jgi:DNA-directed RNA polymerase subunit M/transcription elongation factor TFIIS
MPSEPQTEKQERACPQCGGEMKWSRSEALPKLGLVEHLFACRKCGHLEMVSRPAQPRSAD